MPYRKIVKIVSKQPPSPFDNIDYVVLLECGHETSVTYHYGEKVIGRRKNCYQCPKSEGSP